MIDDLLASDDDCGDYNPLLLNMLGRDHQPKIENFYEDILPAYSDFNFRRCVRVPRSVFAYLLDTLSVHVSDPPHFGGRTA
ncbi:hypothetical protein LSAT2_030617, partial [Lamellibrachia satsuma]